MLKTNLLYNTKRQYKSKGFRYVLQNKKANSFKIRTVKLILNLKIYSYQNNLLAILSKF